MFLAFKRLVIKWYLDRGFVFIFPLPKAFLVFLAEDKKFALLLPARYVKISYKWHKVCYLKHTLLMPGLTTLPQFNVGMCFSDIFGIESLLAATGNSYNQQSDALHTECLLLVATGNSYSQQSDALHTECLLLAASGNSYSQQSGALHTECLLLAATGNSYSQQSDALHTECFLLASLVTVTANRVMP